ncbi:glycosyltransferase [Aureibaculum marinum]|uniref:glycosyltransferase n=1 Tax=Aureibaculum marinum TaxID=2487930 RepID=UPI001EEFF6D9|nr:glycosyltransferase [Aureibaculum marinum]
MIICARNEAQNLSRHLEKFLTQRYTDFEVIVVNDGSTDNSSDLLHTYQKRFSHLKVVDIKSNNSYSGNKKKAISKGIKASKYDYLLFSDADCEPSSKYWISEMSSQFSTNKKIVLGYGAYRKINNSFLNKLIRFETLMTAIQYFSYVKIGLPYMGVGRNLAYHKELFIKVNGLSSHANLKSGDDDLFVNQVAKINNTAICFSKKSFTISEPNTSFKAWFNQKKRHITTANYYKPIHKLLLGFYYLSQILFWILAIILLSLSLIGEVEFWSVIVIVLIRLVLQFIILSKAAEKLDERDLSLWFPILDILLVFMQLQLFVSNLIAKPKYW